MIKQKVQAVALSFISFGLSLSFWACFKGNLLGFVPFVFAVLCASFLFLSKKKKVFFEDVIKLQPFACSAFLFAFLLSFLPVSMYAPFLFSSVVALVICLNDSFKLKKEVKNQKAFLFCSLFGGFIGGGVGFFCSPCLSFLSFFVLSLLCPVFYKKQSIQEFWKDVALPVFLLLFSFASFMIVNHQENFPLLVFESLVMVLIGAMPFICQKSPLRLTLVTLVLMAFGSYVFLTQNPASVFNDASVVSAFELS